MFKKLSLLASMVLILGLTSNCGTFINFFSANKGVHGFDHHGIIFQNTVRSESTNPDIGSKSGKACQSVIWFILPLIAFGDASLPTARAEGGISRINHISYEKTRILGPVYMEDCVIVHGN